MISRSSVLAALVVLELATLGEGIVAIRGGGPSSPTIVQRVDARMGTGVRLVEDGPAKRFTAGPHPRLTVDIGYADLTIVTGNSAEIVANVNGGNSLGPFQANGPISARADGDTVTVAVSSARNWSGGDMRMVTVVVPPETRLTVLNAGDIKVSGLRSDASIKSVGHGSISIEDYRAETLHAEAKGRIRLLDVSARRVDVTSSDGRIEGSGLRVHDGRIESDGRLRLAFAAGADTIVYADAHDGKIDLTGLTGTSAPRKSNDDDDDRTLQMVRIGEGTGHLDVTANDGNITLEQTR